MKRDSPKQALIMSAFGLVPVIWLGLIVAPAISGGQGLAGQLPDLITKLTAALNNPLQIEWCEDSVKISI